MRTIVTKLLIFIPLVAFELSAQVTWTANATTAVPNFPSNGVVKTTTVDSTVHGRGLRPLMTPNGFGTSLAYVPVTAPQGTQFACIGLRAADASSSGSVMAEFLRQPRQADPGPAVTMGSVTTTNAAGDGFQFVTAPFIAQTIDYERYSYYVRIIFSYQGAATAVIASPIAFDVSLRTTCQ